MKVGDRHYRSIWREGTEAAVHVIDQARLPVVFERCASIPARRSPSDQVDARARRAADRRHGRIASRGGTRDPSDESISKARTLRATRPPAVNSRGPSPHARQAEDAKRADRRSRWKEAQRCRRGCGADEARQQAWRHRARMGGARAPGEYSSRIAMPRIATVDWGTVNAPSSWRTTRHPAAVWWRDAPAQPGPHRLELAGHGVPHRSSPTMRRHLCTQAGRHGVVVRTDRSRAAATSATRSAVPEAPAGARQRSHSMPRCPRPHRMDHRGRHREIPIEDATRTRCAWCASWTPMAALRSTIAPRSTLLPTPRST